MCRGSGSVSPVEFCAGKKPQDLDQIFRGPLPQFFSQSRDAPAFIAMMGQMDV